LNGLDASSGVVALGNWNETTATIMI